MSPNIYNPLFNLHLNPVLLLPQARKQTSVKPGTCNRLCRLLAQIASRKKPQLGSNDALVGGPRVEKHDRSGGVGCLVERSEFELPVPVSKLSYEGIMLGFAIETGCEALLPGTAFLAHFSFCRWKRRSQNGAASLWNPVAESVAAWRMPEKASLERCDSSAEPALFRTIKATRLSVAKL
jgi:hypothetical protein